jgi:hypothetical protein
MQIRRVGDWTERLFGIDTRAPVLSKAERATLVAARDICERADELCRSIARCPDPDNDYNLAYCALAGIVGSE